MLGHQARTLTQVLGEVHQTLKADSDAVPAWTRVPKHVPRVPFGPGQPETTHVDVDLCAGELADAREIIARLIADVDADVSEWTEEDDQPYRSVECWLSLGKDDLVSVHLGTSEIARLSGESRKVGDSIRRWGGRSRTLRVNAVLCGADPATATLELTVETPIG